MAVVDKLTYAAEKEEEESPEPPPLPHSGVSLPILLLLQFHKAFRHDLAELLRSTVDASDQTNSSTDFVLDLHRRFEFLKLFHKYYSASEDEVIFLALDVHIKDLVPSTYSLENKSIDQLFDSIFHYLNILIEEDEYFSESFQKLVFCIATMETTICQHMLKEEKQVFPLLMQQFTSRKQASLVWQFICSIPIILLEDLLPWMTSFLSPNERMDYINGVKEVLPEENLLQEVVISWFENKEQTSFGAYNKCRKSAQVLTLEDILKMRASEDDFGDEQQLNRALLDAMHNPVDGINVWHGAIRKDLNLILEELCQVRSSNSFLTLDLVIVQLKFFSDILIVYSNALDKIFYPLWNELAKGSPSVPRKHVLDFSQIEGLQRFLCGTSQHSMPLNNSFMRVIHKHLAYLEAEIFPYIRIKCNKEKQQLLMYRSLQMMPLGLLKCMITWFSTHLSDDESMSIMYIIKQGGALANKSLTSLISEWVFFGYSGKISNESFRKDLQERFNTNHESTSPPSLLLVFFPQIPLTIFRAESSGTSSLLNLGSSPTAHILFFHKALKKDLENLVILSSNSIENLRLLPEFHWRFHLVKYLYQMHSDSENDVAFPAVEAKGTFRNISNSYAIDHKLEFEQFNKISLLLEEISELRLLVINGDVEARGQRMLKYRRMCAKLHNMCLCMQKLVFDHIHREELEIWPLFRETFSVEEQVKIIGCMLGRTRAEMLQEMIPWLMAYLTREELYALMSLWQKATKNTMFNEWLDEWWEGTNVSGWISTQQQNSVQDHNEEFPGQFPSYRDPLNLTFGCKHYKRNCKILASCCNKLYACRYCHDEVSDHSMDRKATTKMMCMKCMILQPVGPKCLTVSCHNLSMAKYYCNFCKLFDDEREIFHCPYCNLCRVGKGLGIDYFHCMNCNACLSKSLSVHICREKCLEDSCPVCHEFMFTSTSPVKVLRCGHMMHSSCFQEYTCTQYTCHVCSKSLGDMQKYFGMLDDLLDTEIIPDLYAGQTQDISCNDCENRGTAAFHWLYHKCSFCGSYNTKLL